MSASTYTTAMSKLRVSEGGYVNNPRDPGGATNFGVTQAVYDAYRKRVGLPARGVRSITEVEVGSIYRTQYANLIRYDDLPAGLDYATLDGAVNSGVSRGAKWLQVALRVTADGAIGPATIAKAVAAEPISTIKSMCARRMGFLRGLGTFSTFGTGWTRRVTRVEADSVAMALSSRGVAPARIADFAFEEAVKASDAASNQNATAASATLPAGGAVASATAYKWDAFGLTLIGIAVVGCVILGIYLLRKSSINRSRASAYEAVAKEHAQ